MAVVRRVRASFLGIVIAIVVAALFAAPVVVMQALSNHALGNAHPVSMDQAHVNAGQPDSSAAASPPATSSTATALATPVGACTDPSALTATFSSAAASPGHHYFRWTITNSGQPCALGGYPLLVERDATGAIAPAITIVNVTGLPVSPATVGLATSTASFFVDLQPCDQEVQMPLETYTVAVSFGGLRSPITMSLPSAFGYCLPQTMDVSPITAGVVAIPGYTTTGSPPDNLVVPIPPKSPGAGP